MSQVKTKFITDNAVDDTKARLRNNNALRGRNAADSGDISILKVNASDRVEFSSIPQVTSDPSAANDVARKSYVDAVAAAAHTPAYESLTLNGTDITNQYKDLAHLVIANSLQLSVDGVMQYLTDDYTLSTISGVTRVTFAGDLATGGASALVSGDKLRLYYQY